MDVQRANVALLHCVVAQLPDRELRVGHRQDFAADHRPHLSKQIGDKGGPQANRLVLLAMQGNQGLAM